MKSSQNCAIGSEHQENMNIPQTTIHDNCKLPTNNEEMQKVQNETPISSDSQELVPAAKSSGSVPTRNFQTLLTGMNSKNKTPKRRTYRKTINHYISIYLALFSHVFAIL